MAAYTGPPQETYRSAAAAIRDATDPHGVESDLAVSPRGAQILLEHPREAATLLDLGRKVYSVFSTVFLLLLLLVVAVGCPAAGFG